VPAEWPCVGLFDAHGEGVPSGSDPSLERIEAGGIPVEAEVRLKALSEPGALFTSTLGVGEFALLSELNFVPLGQVLGASVHQVGWQYLPAAAQWGGEVFCALDLLMHAWDQARRRAFDRLTEEASLLGADAVVGVHLRRGEHDWARGAVDYVVSGTAIKWGTASGPQWPVLSDLSVQDYWKLVKAGWRPAGLVAATAVFFVSQSTRTWWRRRITVTRNQELEEFSRGFSAARETAVRYLRSQASAVGASGIVGVKLEHRVSRERVRVATQVGRQRTGLSPATLAMGGDVPTEGRDKRDGLAVTIQAVGTAIRRERQTLVTTPQATLWLGERA